MYELYLVVSGFADEILDKYLRKINCILGKTREISVSLVCHRGVAPFLNMKFILHNYLNSDSEALLQAVR
jgi:hypothetical protein